MHSNKRILPTHQRPQNIKDGPGRTELETRINAFARAADVSLQDAMTHLKTGEGITDATKAHKFEVAVGPRMLVVYREELLAQDPDSEAETFDPFVA
jgi:hypothetical protein